MGGTGVGGTGVGDFVGDFDAGGTLGVEVREDVDTNDCEGADALPSNRLKIIFSRKESQSRQLCWQVQGQFNVRSRISFSEYL